MIDWIKCSERLPEKEGYYLIASDYPEFKKLYEETMYLSLAYFKLNIPDSLYPNLEKEGFYVYTYTLGDGFSYQDRVNYWAEVPLPRRKND